MRREYDFSQPAGKDERAERWGDPPVQRHDSGSEEVHIGNPALRSLRSRRTATILVGVAALGVLVSVIAGRKRALPPPLTSATGIRMGRSCSQATVAWLDELNRGTARARINVAYCAAQDGKLILVKMRATDGRVLRWQADEGAGALRLRLETGE
jgi:hypothetical protein